MKFWSRAKLCEANEPSPSGSKMANTYTIKIDNTGHKTLIKTGETDIYTAIQKDLESTKLENILQQAAYDPSVLNIREGFYADITELPKTLGEMQQIVMDAKEEFKKLPNEIKERFDNSAEVFVNEFGKDGFNEKLINRTVNEETAEGETVVNE